MRVQFSPGGGNAVWGEDGTVHRVKTFDLRIYRGEFTAEPATDPIGEASRSMGKRVGQGEACSFRAYNPDHNATAFIDITVTTKP